MITINETVLLIIILFLIPFIIFGYAVNFTTIEHQQKVNIILKDEICRLNEIIEELKGTSRTCWIPTFIIEKPNEKYT